MVRRPPRSTRTYPLLPYTTLFRSLPLVDVMRLAPGGRSITTRPDAAAVSRAECDALPGREEPLIPAYIDDLSRGVAEDRHRRSEARPVGQECVSTCRSQRSPAHYTPNIRHYK